MSNDPELLKKLIDDDELDEVELQKGKPSLVVKGIFVPSSKKKAARSRCPCWCKCIGITIMVFGLIGILSLICAYFYLADVVEHLTIETDSPQKFPVVKMSDLQLRSVQYRVHSFIVDIADEENDIEDLVLTQEEINAFIGHSDYLRGNLMIALHEDRIVEQFSLPMDVLGFNGRYFVGSEYLALKSDGEQGDGEKKILEAKMETEGHEDWFDGPLFFMQLQYLITKNKEDEGQTMLELYLEKGTFFGQVVSEEDINHDVNLMDGFYDADDDDVESIQDVISGIESVSIGEGKVVVKARRPKSN